MSSFLSAHGFDPGPTQRPVLAGLIAGGLGAIPATGLLVAFGSLAVETRILGLSVSPTLVAGGTAMAVAGALYGRLFRRGANDRRGGWLFGMAYGFLLWATGAVMALPLLSGGEAPAGTAAIGFFLSLVLWGAAMGALFPHVHRPLHVGADRAEAWSLPQLGPGAAASRRRRRHQR